MAINCKLNCFGSPVSQCNVYACIYTSLVLILSYNINAEYIVTTSTPLSQANDFHFMINATFYWGLITSASPTMLM